MAWIISDLEEDDEESGERIDCKCSEAKIAQCNASPLKNQQQTKLSSKPIWC